MSTHRIKFKDREIICGDGELLSDALIKAGESVERPCGGRGVCRKCIVIVNGKEELSCKYKVHSDIILELPERGEMISETGAEITGSYTKELCFALDIGTTTLALALISLDESKIVKVITRTNPQRAFGADIMTRIDYCRKNSVSELNSVLITEINRMFSEFSLPERDKKKLFVSGNTTMLHLFFGVDCSSIGEAPYTPAFLDGRCSSGESLGLTGISEAVSLPSISAFVGADLVAGLNYVSMPEKGKYSLLIDLGTNAEVLLFSGDGVLCTAAAAGPCFEGANISCGMSATSGAVYSYNAAHGNPEVKTIGDTPARGICGTGLVDIIAALLNSETVDETGFMECGVFEITDGVTLTQEDIRQYQLAKSAVCSAILTLMKIKGIEARDIDKMFISGGFSAKINIENAVKTGLLPASLADRCISVNNSSLLGTVRYACEQNTLSGFTDRAEYVDLSSNSYFTELFVENMMFDTQE